MLEPGRARQAELERAEDRLSLLKRYEQELEEIRAGNRKSKFFLWDRF